MKHALSIFVVGVLWAQTVAANDSIIRKPDPVAGRYIVSVRKPLQAPVEILLSTLLDDVPARVLYTWKDAVVGFALEMTEDEALHVSRLPFVQSVEEDGRITLASIAQNWGIDRVDNQTNPRLDFTYTACRTGSGTLVYVLDSGVWAGHSEFANGDPAYPGQPRVRSGYDVIGVNGPANNPCQGFYVWPYIRGSHGTAVASVIAGQTMGTAPNATIVPVRVINCTQDSNESTVITGIDWIRRNAETTPGVGHVVNMSFVVVYTVPVSSYGLQLEAAVQSLLDSGITVVAAAGNANAPIANSSRVYSPARIPGVITVAGTRGEYASDPDTRWDNGPLSCPNGGSNPGSNYGPEVDLFAPADHIRVAYWADANGNPDPYAIRPTSDACYSSGTSFATGLTSGMAARILQTRPTLGPLDLRNWLRVYGSYPSLNILNRMTAPNILLYRSPTDCQ